MGLLVNGKWQDKWYETDKTDGKFQRQDSLFRNWITPDGSPGPQGKGGFKAEKDRYHLYVCYACPWAHRTLIGLQVKGLSDFISVDAVHPVMGEEGWTFETDFAGATGDRVHNKKRLYEIYLMSEPQLTSRVTVPVLWDKETHQIVNNESSEILRMLNSSFNEVGATGPDLYPAEFREEIEDLNEKIYHSVNNGVYKAGFATTQSAYEGAFKELFEVLDELEARLTSQRYLVNTSYPTEADWRLFTTLLRFDAVYVGHFKCNLRTIESYPALSNYLRDLYQHPGVEETVRMDHIKTHYYVSHPMINPTQIVPLGPALNFKTPHNRASLP